MYIDIEMSDAKAYIKGGVDYPEIKGVVRFYQKGNGVLVMAQINGLPETETGFFGFHIHEGNLCSGEGFENTGGHYNPQNVPHPSHAGDLPPLISAGGMAKISFITDRFTVGEIIGKTAVIHDMPDDFMTQPSGNSGKKIACGVIEKI